MVLLRPASEMKDSGIDAVANIPKEWNVRRIKYILNERNERVDDADPNDLLSVSEYYGVAPRAEKMKSDATLMRAETLEGYKICKCNDLVVNIMLAWKGALGVSEYEGVVSPSYCVYSPICDDVVMKYLHYLFTTDSYKTYFRHHSTGIIDSRLRLYTDEFFSLWCVLPPLSEQQVIANYLDDRCSMIDGIIAEATASIEEYKELKQSVVFEAVTKGLDKNVPMKDSGVEWIGDIPASWTYFKLRYVVDDIGDIDHYMPESVMCGIPYVMTGDLKDVASKIDFDSCKQVSYEDYIKLSKKISVNKGDVIFARYASIGVICYVDIDKDFLVSYSCVTIKPKHDLINGWFLKYYLQSSAFKEEVMRYANSNVQANVGKESMYQAKIALPSMDEQKEIVNYLDIKVGDIESLISEKQSLIEDLQAYKKSLIYEVVTGKRRVV